MLSLKFVFLNFFAALQLSDARAGLFERLHRSKAAYTVLLVSIKGPCLIDVQRVAQAAVHSSSQDAVQAQTRPIA